MCTIVFAFSVAFSLTNKRLLNWSGDKRLRNYNVRSIVFGSIGTVLTLYYVLYLYHINCSVSKILYKNYPNLLSIYCVHASAVLKTNIIIYSTHVYLIER